MLYLFVVSICCIDLLFLSAVAALLLLLCYRDVPQQLLLAESSRQLLVPPAVSQHLLHLLCYLVSLSNYCWLSPLNNYSCRMLYLSAVAVPICCTYLLSLSAGAALLSCVLQQLLLAESSRQRLVPPAVSICCVYLLCLSDVSISNLQSVLPKCRAGPGWFEQSACFSVFSTLSKLSACPAGFALPLALFPCEHVAPFFSECSAVLI